MSQSRCGALCATLALAIAGCADPVAVSPSIAPADLSGTWAYDASIAVAGGPDTCTTAGTATFAQSGAELDGSTASTFSCTTPAGRVWLTGFGSIDGAVSARAVSFRDAECRYEGTVGSDGALSGSVHCSILVGGAQRELSGSWEAHRVAS